MVSQAFNPHFILFPMMAQGHLIPMIDITRLLAQRGVIVTIFTTPKNASRFDSVLSRAVHSCLPIRVVHLQFPSKEAGLPEGCENMDMTSLDLGMIFNFFDAISMLQTQAEKLFEELTPQPSCIISDMCIPWTIQIAQKHGIPRIAFHGFSCFCLHCLHKIRTFKVLESITSESQFFTVPGIPHHFEVNKSQIPLPMEHDRLKEFHEQMVDAETSSYGAIINTFEELEGEYVEDYKKERKDKVWCIGPVSLCNKDELDKAQRGNKASINEKLCLKWLDSQQTQSVVYVCLGSLCNLIPSQLAQLALALEASEKPFIWVIRGGNRLEELESWIKEDGFEERMEGRGLLIRGWAPQVLILSHSAIGGFITHCGWNSTLEGISAGVPMVTWPLFADQFLNEKLVCQVLRIGVSIGVEAPMKWGEEDKIGVVVKKEDVEKAICLVMNEGEEIEERRKKAKELSEMAKKAVENGGSSHRNISLLIEDILQQAGKENKVDT
ncbi:UDP-glycosyltransferase 73C25-like [Prosopis cineraria]|uniref:UDP-glycosyltransferase 73C25-like n=1 Tax=Prosopis cineraria TaxID=364024 RepID=UPI002410A30C|nr:UDP-glycosyltransferase 73C25-like [Prosopis cineraria]